jgi:hypothetical protein
LEEPEGNWQIKCHGNKNLEELPMSHRRRRLFERFVISANINLSKIWALRDCRISATFHSGLIEITNNGAAKFALHETRPAVNKSF